VNAFLARLKVLLGFRLFPFAVHTLRTFMTMRNLDVVRAMARTDAPGGYFKAAVDTMEAPVTGVLGLGPMDVPVAEEADAPDVSGASAASGAPGAPGALDALDDDDL
jgi:hypothetical protein